MKKKLALVLAAALALSLVGCGGKSGDAANTTETEETAEAPEPDVSPEEKYPANIDPADIHPGSLNSDEDTSDRWYPNGDTSAEICFTLTQTSKQDDCVGLAFCQYKVLNGSDDDLIDMPLRDGGNGHAITGEFTFMKDKSETYDHDFTFQDNFTCYDFKTDTVYKRCHPDYGCKDQEWYDNAFAGKLAYRELSSSKEQKIKFNEDHTFVESVTDMDDMTGHWEVKAANVLDLVYDNPEDSGVQQIDAGSLLEDGGESGDETSYSDTWQQEFNISADGEITEFGLFPKYDDDMNLIGYEPAFEFTTEEALASAAEDVASRQEEQVREDINDMTGVDLDAPATVFMSSDDYDGACKAINDIRLGEYPCEIVEMHGTLRKKGTWLEVEFENGEGRTNHFQINVSGLKYNELDTMPVDQKVCVKGINWKTTSSYMIATDKDHVTVE